MRYKSENHSDIFFKHPVYNEGDLKNKDKKEIKQPQNLRGYCDRGVQSQS